jgi:hypothetical protein
MENMSQEILGAFPIPIVTQCEGELLGRWLRCLHTAAVPTVYDGTLVRRCHVDAMTLETLW